MFRVANWSIIHVLDSFVMEIGEYISGTRPVDGPFLTFLVPKAY